MHNSLEIEQFHGWKRYVSYVTIGNELPDVTNFTAEILCFDNLIKKIFNFHYFLGEMRII